MTPAAIRFPEAPASTVPASNTPIGAVYTPAFVAEEIVARTWAPLRVRARQPDAPLRVLDPACGAGVFLIAAFRSLLAEAGQRAASRAERARLLAAHIFGVDLDPSAVAATRAALAALVLEAPDGPAFAEPPQSTPPQSTPPQSMPGLDAILEANIRHGDALIDPTDWRRPGPAPPEALAWQAAFPTVLAEGGFDVIVGNPPYRRERDAKALFDRIAGTGLGQRWRAPRMDLWYYFLHRSLDLLAPRGRLGFIVSAYWTAGTGATRLIGRLRAENLLAEIVNLERWPIFPGVSGRHLILILDRAKADDRVRLHSAAAPCPDAPSATRSDAERLPPLRTVIRPAATVFRPDGLCLTPVGPDLDDDARAAPPPRLPGMPAETPQSAHRLGQLATIREGIAENPATITARLNARYDHRFQTGAGVFVLTRPAFAALELSAGEAETLARPYHGLRALGRYHLAPMPETILLYATAETAPEIELLPGLFRHLARYRPILEARREVRLDRIRWWQLHWPRAPWLWTTPKLIAVQMAARPSLCLAETPCYTSFSTHVIVPHDNSRQTRLRLLGWLNAAPVHAWIDRHAKRRGIGYDLSGRLLRAIPVPALTPGNRHRWDHLAALAEQRMALGGAAAPETTTDAPARARLEAALDQTARTLAACLGPIEEVG